MRRNLQRSMALVILALALASPVRASTSQDGDAAQTSTELENRVITSSQRARSAGDASLPATAGPSAGRVIGSLAAVAILIVGLGWTYKRLFAQQQQKSGGAVSLVSRSLLTPRHQVLVLRAGHRLLVVGDSGHGMNLLAEVTDPAEITAILGEAGQEADRLKAEAFAASLDSASQPYEPLPDGQSEPVEHPPSLEAAHGEVRSLIERVRGLAGHMGPPAERGANQVVG